MKQSLLKYIFAIIVVGLILYAIYILYGNQEENSVNTTESTSYQETEIITNIRIPLVNFDTMNPILSKNQNVQNIARLIYEPLLEMDEEYKIKLCLAKEWTKTSPTSYVIKLKEDIQWQDGNMFTAKDVQFTIDQLKNSNISSIYTDNVQSVIRVEVIDDHTIKIILNQEVPFFEYYLTFPIMSYHNYENEDFTTSSKNYAPVGTGRFKVVLENENISLKQNENWWNKEEEPTKLTKIQLIKYGNMGEVYNAFKIGNIDLLTTESLEIQNYIGTIGYNLKEYKGRQLDYLVFNCNKEELARKEVRRAISQAIDKQNIVSAIYGGKYYLSNFPLDYGSYLYEPEKVKHEYNIEKAIQLLQENGWELNRKTWQKVENYRTIRLKFDLVVNASNENRVAVAENIKNNLENMLGIKINIIKATDVQYQKYLENKNYDMLLTGVYSSYSPDLSSYFGNNNLANFHQQDLERLMQEVNNITDAKLLKEKYNQIIDIYKEEMPYVFLYYNRSTLIGSPKLIGDIKPNYYNPFFNIGTWYRQ